MRNLRVDMRSDGSAVINGQVVPVETLNAARAIAVGFRLDATDTMVFARQLETIKSRVYRKRYAELKGRQFVSVSSEGGNASEQITYRMWDAYVTAKIVSNYATDIPTVTATASEHSAKYKSVAAGYEYTIQDVRNALKAGTDLQGELAFAVRRAIEQAIDEMIAKGVPEASTYGLLNNPNVPIVTLPTGNWATATVDQILADLNYLVQSIIDATNQMWEPDTILMDTGSFARVGQKIIGSDYSTTIIRTFLANNPYITNVDQWTRLNTADAAGTGPRILCYKRDPEIAEFELGQEFEQFPAQPMGLAFKVPCHARGAGVLVRHPYAMAYADNAG